MGVYELYCNHPAIEDMLFRFFSEAKVRIRLQVHHIVTLTKLSLSLSLSRCFNTSRCLTLCLAGHQQESLDTQS